MDRSNPVAWLRRLVRASPAPSTQRVHDHAVDCPQGTTTVERCLQCDRLILLHVGQAGNGTVECTPERGDSGPKR